MAVDVNRPPADAVGRVACVGCGVIGGGWAALFLARGHDVIAFAPSAAEEAPLRHLVEAAWPSLDRLGLSTGASPDRLAFTTDLGTAVADADFVQESVPEDLDLKQRLFAGFDDLVPPGVVIASSTSGFAMTDIQARCRTAARTTIGHPFNPPYIVPLVEVVGGARTAPETVEWTAAFYTHVGKSVLRLSQEVPGFVANRLQEALWREALHMVAAGEATVEEIDAAVTDGPGLRWAAMGPCLTFHLAGGDGGMARMLDHFGPALEEPWTRLKAPPLTDELHRRMVDGCDAAAAGRSVFDLVRHRDACLVDFLECLERRRDAPA